MIQHSHNRNNVTLFHTCCRYSNKFRPCILDTCFTCAFKRPLIRESQTEEHSSSVWADPKHTEQQNKQNTIISTITLHYSYFIHNSYNSQSCFSSYSRQIWFISHTHTHTHKHNDHNKTEVTGVAAVRVVCLCSYHSTKR